MKKKNKSLEHKIAEIDFKLQKTKNQKKITKLEMEKLKYETQLEEFQYV